MLIVSLSLYVERWTLKELDGRFKKQIAGRLTFILHICFISCVEGRCTSCMLLNCWWIVPAYVPVVRSPTSVIVHKHRPVFVFLARWQLSHLNLFSCLDFREHLEVANRAHVHFSCAYRPEPLSGYAEHYLCHSRLRSCSPLPHVSLSRRIALLLSRVLHLWAVERDPALL